MNKVTHFEFPWDDKERAKSFYQKVFDWKPFEWEQFSYTSWQTGPVDEKMERWVSLPGLRIQRAISSVYHNIISKRK